MRFLSLYSGIGLHDLGFNRAGIEIVGQVELDPYCRAVLEMHWPGLPRWSDVRDVTVDAVRRACGAIDGITGGFSCQDISVAGAGKGIGRETRSGLTWREMFRLIRGLRPAWLVIENVPRLRTLAADRVIAAMERIGYACWAVVVGAEHVGAPHRRHRVWIIGRLADALCDTDSIVSRDGLGPSTEQGQEGSADRCVEMGDASDGGRGSNTAADAQETRSTDSRRDSRKLSRRSGRSGCGDLADADNLGREGIRGSGLLDGERSALGHDVDRCDRWPARPGEPQHDWEAPRLVESGVGGATSGRARRLAGFARRSALKALGNANPPQCAEVIGRAVLAFAKEAA